jgi:hypothetical protein
MISTIAFLFNIGGKVLTGKYFYDRRNKIIAFIFQTEAFKPGPLF